MKRLLRIIKDFSHALPVVAIIIASVGIFLQTVQMINENNKISFNLDFENNNNLALIKAVLAAKDEKDYHKIWLSHFYTNYSQEYMHRNLRNHSIECLSAYNNYLQDLHKENATIDLISSLRQELILANKEISQASLEGLNGELVRYNDWSYGEVLRLNNYKCF